MKRLVFCIGIFFIISSLWAQEIKWQDIYGIYSPRYTLLQKEEMWNKQYKDHIITWSGNIDVIVKIEDTVIARVKLGENTFASILFPSAKTDQLVKFSTGEKVVFTGVLIETPLISEKEIRPSSVTNNSQENRQAIIIDTPHSSTTVIRSLDINVKGADIWKPEDYKKIQAQVAKTTSTLSAKNK